jgi:hypothetical protein
MDNLEYMEVIKEVNKLVRRQSQKYAILQLEFVLARLAKAVDLYDAQFMVVSKIEDIKKGEEDEMQASDK